MRSTDVVIIGAGAAGLMCAMTAAARGRQVLLIDHPWDFIAMVSKHGVPYHEKTLGQLFCDNKSRDILEMLLEESHQRSPLGLAQPIFSASSTMIPAGPRK